MTEWKDCSETPSASCSGILGRNQITHSLSRTLSSLAVYEGGLLAPFRLVEEKGEEEGGEAWRGLVTASNSFEVARDRFPPPPRTVDSNCFCPGVDRVEQFPLLRGTPGVRRASGTGNRWLWHRVSLPTLEIWLGSGIGSISLFVRSMRSPRRTLSTTFSKLG